MNERELLELAAKAAGIEIYFDIDGDCYRVKTSDNRHYWNPIIYDGDALRLAVKLKIDVKHYDDHVVGWFDGGYIGTGRIFYDGDPLAATRRAIVMAAAEIGRNT